MKPKRNVTHKTCAKCGETKPVSEFSPSGRDKNDGYTYRCRACLNEDRRAWYARDPEFRRKKYEETIKWQATNPDKVKESRHKSDKKRYWNNRGERLAHNKKYRDEHPEKAKEYRERKKSRPKVHVESKVCHRCKSEKQSSEFRHSGSTKDGLQVWCKDCQNAYQREQFASNPKFKEYHNHKINSRRVRLLGNGGSHTKKEWLSLCDRYDNRCVCCGEKKRLQRDHVKPLIDGGTDDVDNLQPLCRSCNSRKGTKYIDYRNGEVAMLILRQKEQHG